MKETRRLDVLAVIGAILALAVILQMRHVRLGGGRCPSKDVMRAREAILKRMPDSDIKADFEISSPLETSGDSATKIKLLDQAIKKYPESARLHFRRGNLGKDPQSCQALKRAAELDPKNALPLYVLASRVMSRGSEKEAAALLAQGNRRDRLDEYRLPYRIARGNPDIEIAISTANTETGLPTYAALRQLAKGVCDSALKLHAAGQTGRALDMLRETKRMGWSLMRSNDAVLLDVLFGVALVRVCHKSENQIYSQTSSQSGLAQLEREKRRLMYLSAGASARIDMAMDELTARIARGSAVVLPIAYTAAIQSLLIIMSLAWWGTLVIRARKNAASEVHIEATARAFRAGRLLKLYALIFLPPGIAVSVLAYLAISGGSVVLAPISFGVAACIPCLLLWRANVLYKTAYRQTAEAAGLEVPRLWKGVPVQDKREVARRLVGVQGGMMLFLLLCGLLVSGGAKLALGAYPWETRRIVADIHQEETRYVADLVAGKVKVPEKYIREQEQREKRGAESAAAERLRRKISPIRRIGKFGM